MIPLASSLHSSATHEQTTSKSLERKIIKEFKDLEFIVCTDEGLSAKSNKFYNSISGKVYVTTQPINNSKGI